MAKTKIARQKYRRDITAAELRAKLDYHPETGEFWTKPRKVGSIHMMGRNRDYPAVIVTFSPGNGTHKKFYAQRLAWLWMTGEWPTEEVDHENGISTDNRWSNLRAATRSENTQNRGVGKYNTSGMLGAFYDKSIGKWRSYIRGIYLGIFQTKDEAHAAYRNAALNLYGKFAHSSLIELRPHTGLSPSAETPQMPQMEAPPEKSGASRSHPEPVAVGEGKGTQRNRQPHLSTGMECTQDHRQSGEGKAYTNNQLSLAAPATGSVRGKSNR